MADTWDLRDLESIRSPALAAALAYWRSKAAISAGADAARIPGRAELDPLEMRAFLTKILIIDVIDATGAPEAAETGFVYRLCGSEVTDNNGRDLAGRRADAASLGASAPQWIDSYQRTIATRAPILFVGGFWWQDRGYITFEQINLPLAGDGAVIDKLLCVVDFARSGAR